MLNIVARYIKAVSPYIAVSISVPAMLIRLMFLVLVYWMHNKITSDDEIEQKLYNVYVFGMFLFFALSFSGIISQRLTMPLKAIEIVLIPIQLKHLVTHGRIVKQRKKKHMIALSKNCLAVLCTAVVLIIPVVECVKNINSYILQGNYYDSVNVVNYPYFSIWEKNDVEDYLSHFHGQLE